LGEFDFASHNQFGRIETGVELEELLEGDAVALGDFLDAVTQAYGWAFFEGREILEWGGAP
jgi:hypothetical protein